MTPNFSRRYSKVSLGRGLVKMFAVCSFVPIYSNLIFFYVTCSWRKWNLIGICLVLECITRFLEILMALVLWHRIEIISSHVTCISWSVFFIQRIQVAPKETHIIAVKRIFGYLKGTMDFGLWYPKGNELTLIAFSDANWEDVLTTEEAPMKQHSF